MEIISLRIRTKDEEYGRVLQTVLKRNYPGFMITLEIIGGAGDPEGGGIPAGSTGGWGIDLSLCDDRASLEQGEVLLVELPAQENVVVTGDLPDETAWTAGKPACLFKYAPAREMIGKILWLCSAHMHRQIFLPRAERCRLVGVFSGAGGKGCTAVSLALAQMSARLRGSRPLVMTLSQLPRGGAGAATAGVMPLREFVCRTLQERGNAAPSLLERAASADAFGTSRFACPAGENPLHRLSGEGMRAILDTAAGGRYDHLFIDIGTVLNEASFEALRAADSLLMLSGTPEDDKALLEYLRLHCGGGVLEKVIRIRNRYEAKEPTALDRFYEADDAEPDQAEYQIPYEPALDHERGAAQDPVFPLDGGFADALEELLTILETA
jgi:hypothetical protein